MNRLFRILLPPGLLVSALAATPPRLLPETADLRSLRAQAATPVGRAITARLDALLAEEPSVMLTAHHAAGHALRFLLTGEETDAARALSLCEEVISDRRRHRDPGGREVALWHEPYKAIIRAPAAVGVALALDWAGSAWPEDRRQVVARQLGRLARELIEGVGEGYNPRLESNWQATTKAAGGLAALALLGDPAAPDGLEALLLAARDGVERHLRTWSRRGWPHEGFNYLRYPMSHGLPAFVAAWRHWRGEDLAATTALSAVPALYAMVLVPPAHPGAGPALPFFGLAYHSSRDRVPYPLWEVSEFRGGDMAALLAIASGPDRGNLAWIYARCFGEPGDGTWDVHKPSDAVFALAHAPGADSTRFAPLPDSWIDEQAGIFFWRGEWRDGGDRIVGLSANVRPGPGLYSFADAGSFRLLALGGRWAVQRQAGPEDAGRIRRDRENVVVIPDTHEWGPGRIVRAETDANDVHRVELDLDAVYRAPPDAARRRWTEIPRDLGIRARRTVLTDLSRRSGASVVLIVRDHITAGPGRTWLMHTAEDVASIGDGAFRLRSSSGATLAGTVLLPESAAVHAHAGRWTRTIAVDGEGDFLVVMTVQPAGQPPAAVGWDGAALRVGTCHFPLSPAQSIPQ